MRSLLNKVKAFAKKHPIIAILLVLNSLSFCAARVYWYAKGDFGAELEVLKPAEDGEKMYYLIAGCVNQPRTAFEFLFDELDGGITLVNYQSAKGCSMKSIARQVIADAKQHDYEARVVGISIGDYVARRMEAEIPSTKSVGINPEPKSNILRSWANIASKGGSFMVEVLTVVAGWPTAIPWYNGCGNLFSVTFIADQFRDIGWMSSTPHVINGTMGVIVSERPDKGGDEFLRNSSIEAYFDGVPIARAQASHGNTVDMADAFLEAWRELDLADF